MAMAPLALLAAGTVTTIAGTIQQGQASAQAAQYNAQVARNNAKINANLSEREGASARMRQLANLEATRVPVDKVFRQARQGQATRIARLSTTGFSSNSATVRALRDQLEAEKRRAVDDLYYDTQVRNQAEQQQEASSQFQADAFRRTGAQQASLFEHEAGSARLGSYLSAGGAAFAGASRASMWNTTYNTESKFTS